MSYFFRPEQRDFVTNLMMIGDRINSTRDSPFPHIPTEVMVLILQQMRIHDLGPRVEEEEDYEGEDDYEGEEEDEEEDEEDDEEEW